jgi:PKD repeat protein
MKLLLKKLLGIACFWLISSHALQAQTCLNRALNFVPTNPADYVQTTSSPLTGTGAFTVEALVLVNSTGSTQSRRLLSMGTVAGSPSRFELFELNGQLNVAWQTAGQVALATQGGLGNIRDGNWHHVAATRNGANFWIYIDGVQVYTNSTLIGNFNFAICRLGAAFNSTTPAQCFSGIMDEVRFWTVARTQTEISNAQNCRVECTMTTGLKTYYQFDQGVPNGNNQNVNPLEDCFDQLNGILNTFALNGTASNWVCGKPDFLNQVCTPPCAADFGYQVQNCGTVAFGALQPTPNSSFLWSFGDGGTSTEPNPLHTFTNAGTYTVCLTLNTGQTTCTSCQDVVVTDQSTPPVITCPSSLLMAVNLGCAGSYPAVPTVVWGPCSNTSAQTLICTRSDGQPQNAPFPIGTVSVRCIAGDNDGFDSCTYTVTVIDDQQPQIDCPDNITVQGDLADGGAVVNWPTVIAFDDCSQIQLTCNYPNGSFFDCGSISTIVYSATDAFGNSSACSFMVTVECVPQNSALCGQAVVTCYGAPGEPAAALMDTRYNAAAPLGDDWMNPVSGPPIAKTMYPNWDVSRLGSVFGIATDASYNVYFAASGIYTFDAGFMSFTGTAGRSGIYKADGANLNAVTDLVTTIGSNSAVVGTSTLPNVGGTGNGIGNIAWDATHNQLFVTNLEDGRIYRINPNTGIVLDAYDPFMLDNGANGLAPASERLWGIGVFTAGSTTQVYFARGAFTGSGNAVYSITLTGGGGFPGTSASGIFTGGGEVLEFECGDLAGLTCSDGSNPSSKEKITDIEFAVSGKMLITERGNPHNAKTFELVNAGGAWSVVKQIYTGSIAMGKNSAGGVDYGYREVNDNPTAQCDSIIWNTTNYLIPALNPSNLVYGMQGIGASVGNTEPSGPGHVATDLIVDFSAGDIYEKSQIGDVDIFKCVVCPVQPICEPNCETQSLNISTGYDPATGGVLASGSSDPNWTLVAAPPSSTVIPPFPANIIGPFGTAWANLAGSEWMSAVPFNNYSVNNCGTNDCNCPPFVYQRCFCVCEQTEVTFDFDFLSDDAGAVELWDEVNNILVATLANNCGDGTFPWNFMMPAVSVNTTIGLPKGRYCLKILHWNNGNVAMGVNLSGTVTGAHLLLDACCANPNGGIVGTKYHDLDCDGVRDIKENTWVYLDPGLAAWEFTLTDAANNVVGTAYSDANGQFTFPNLTPGTYTVTETPQLNWGPSNPATGAITVNVTANNIINVEFGNCSLPPATCDSINALVLDDTTKTGCCYVLYINNEKLDFFTGIQIDVLSGAELDVPPPPTAGSQWVSAGFSAGGDWATFVPATGTYIDKGVTDAVYFCLKNSVAPTQQLQINYYGPDGSILCRDTLTLECRNCFTATVDSVFCQDWNDPAARICIEIGEGIDYTVGSIQFIPVTPGVAFGDPCVSLPDLTGGSTICIDNPIFGAMPGDTVCFTAVIHEQDVCVGELDLRCCSNGDTICFIVPDCSPCPRTTAMAVPAQVEGDSCCWNIYLNTPASNYFDGVTTEIITDGLGYSTIESTIGSGWAMSFLSDQEIYWDAVPPQGNFVDNFAVLPLMCFGPDGSGDPIDSPQKVVITWFDRDSSLCTDTLLLDCAFRPEVDCAELDSISITCPTNNPSDFVFTVDITNYTQPAVTATNIQITQVSGSGALIQTDYPVTLPPGGTATIGIQITGMPLDEFCFIVTLQRETSTGQALDCCTIPDTICVTLPNCFPQRPLGGKIFPNPNTGQFSVSFDQPLPTGSHMRIIDMVGHTVSDQPLPTGTVQHPVEMQTLAPGIYYVEIWGDNLPTWRKKVSIARK